MIIINISQNMFKKQIQLKQMTIIWEKMLQLNQSNIWKQRFLTFKTLNLLFCVK